MKLFSSLSSKLKNVVFYGRGVELYRRVVCPNTISREHLDENIRLD